MLRGNHAAKIDDKGRLKIPNAFRALIEKQHGAELFVTSLTGEYVRIYPMPVWQALEERLAKVPSTHPSRLKYFDRVNYYGQSAQIDAQGRVVIHSRLRDHIQSKQPEYLSAAKYMAKMLEIKPDTTDEDADKQIAGVFDQYVKDNPRAKSPGTLPSVNREKPSASRPETNGLATRIHNRIAGM